jgi:folate-dependent phosphoribosylglycinamide formyltransferase PurN
MEIAGGKVCVLGDCSDYTQTMCAALSRSQIPFDLVTVKPRSKAGTPPSSRAKMRRMLRSGPFKGLSVWSPYTWIRFARLTWYRRSSWRRDYSAHLQTGLIAPAATFEFDSWRSAEMADHISSRGYVVGVLGQVGILPGSLLAAFREGCLNAHCGVLPGIRGGCSIPRTLLARGQCAVSVHEAVAEVDAGDVYATEYYFPVWGDNIDKVGLKLDGIGSDLVAQVVKEILTDGQNVTRSPGGGHLGYWRDCSTLIQARADLLLAWLGLKSLLGLSRRAVE